ncbi:MAG: hypothetical protein KDA87_21850 [Planctomycetales bacterium]|nr:hypothetical protein [Planctomycetales bacterium]
MFRRIRPKKEPDEFYVAWSDHVQNEAEVSRHRRAGLGWFERIWIWLLDGAGRIAAWTRIAAYSLCEFGVLWLLSRCFRHLLLGLPVVMFVTILAVTAVVWASRSEFELVQRYQRQAADAAAADDVATAELCFRKLEQLGAVSPRIQFQRAIALDNQGKSQQAKRLMRQLAAESRAAFPEARIWLVQRFLDQDEWDSEAVRDAETQLASLLQTLPESAELVHLSAMLLAKTGQWDRAIRTAERTDSEKIRPSQLALQMKLFLRQGNVQAASGCAQQLQQRIQETSSDGMFNPDQYQLLAEACRVRQDIAGLLNWVRQARTAYPGHAGLAEYQQQLVDEYLSWANSDPWLLPLDDPGEAAEDLAEFIADAIAENLQRLPDRIKQLYGLVARGGFRQRLAQQIAIRLHPSEEGAAELFVSIGRIHEANQQWDESANWYQRAIEFDSNHLVAWNNLANLANLRPNVTRDELAAALSQVNSVVDVSPENAFFRDTRGQLLVRLGEYSLAVTDLEFAINGIADPQVRRSTHRALSTAYSHLGDFELAKHHSMVSKSSLASVADH